MSRMHKFWIGLFLSAWVVYAVAATPEFEATVKLANLDAKAKKTESVNRVKNLDPNTVFDRYTTHPETTKYYGGVTQADTEKMHHDAIQSKNSESGKVITSSMIEHPHFVINPSDPDMQHAQLLQREAYNIVHGMTSQYVDCKPKEKCFQQYEEKFCEEAPQAIFQTCKKTLIVEVMRHENITHYPLVANLSVKDKNYAGVSMSPVTGIIGFLGPKDAKFSLGGRLPANLDCHSLQGAILSTRGNAKLDTIHFPSCANGMQLDMHISDGHQRDITIDMAYKTMTYDVKDRWVDECESNRKDATCKLQSQQCDMPESTRMIEGIPVTRACWQESFNYMCRGGSGEGTCLPLRTAGCEQVGSVCIEKTNDQCTLYHQTYRCVTENCSPTTDVICGNGQDYCLDGSCTDKSYAQSQDFAKGVSALSAVSDAGKQIDQTDMKVFTGHASSCSEIPVGFSNCCTEKGWGQDLELDHCSDGEKKLHVARDNKQAIKVGRYCSGPEPFPCIEHTQVFCVFGSKLANIIQEQGRQGQLHLDFGNAKHPECSGISFEQLQAIDLAKIDFQAFFNEELSKNVKNQDPDLKKIQEVMQQHVAKAMETGKSHG